MKKRYVVRLTPEERERLHDLVHKGRVAAYKAGPQHVRESPAQPAEPDKAHESKEKEIELDMDL